MELRGEKWGVSGDNSVGESQGECGSARFKEEVKQRWRCCGRMANDNSAVGNSNGRRGWLALCQWPTEGRREKEDMPKEEDWGV